MRNTVFLAALLLALAPAPFRAQSALPLLRTVEPVSARAGDVVTVTGENLDRETVAALYLTDGKNDVPMVIVEQTLTSIRFTVPAGIASGRYAVMLLTQGKDRQFIEEPIKITIETRGVGPTL